jgi:hypothetical protein
MHSPPEVRGSQADPWVTPLRLAGLFVVITRTANPYQLTPDKLMNIFATPVTLVGWAPL